MRSIINKIILANEGLSVEHKILNAVSIMGMVLTFITSLTNYLYGLKPATYILPLICVLVFPIIYTFSILKRNFNIFYHLSFGFIVLIFYPMLWCINNGSNGSIPYFLSLFLVFIIITSNQKRKIYYSILLLLVNILLLYIEKNYPALILKYPSPEDRFIDIIISIILSYVVVYATLEIFMNIYRKAIKRVDHQNKELAEKNLQITKQKNRLKELNAEKSKLFHILAHDLRNPFNSIMGLCDILLEDIENKEDIDKKQVKEYLTIIQKSTGNTYHLLEDILEWARTQQEGINIKPKHFKVSSVVQEIFLQLNQQAINKRLELNHSIPENIFITADYEMIKTVVRNLISNAIKFSNPMGKIQVSCNYFKNETLITISDTGCGMDKATLDSLFNSCKVKSQKGTAGEKGTGFGLQICKEFIDQHSGKFWVESKLDIGSEFTFSIPKIYNSSPSSQKVIKHYEETHHIV